MNRRKPLKRGKPLSANPEKVREFLRKHGGLARSALKPKPKPKVQEGPLTPLEWRRQVFVSSGGRCIITGAEARDAEDRSFHAHHVIPKRVLRARGLRGCVWDPRNGVWLLADLHLRRIAGEPEIPRSKLPAAVFEFVRELDALEGTGWASALLLRLYPNP